MGTRARPVPVFVVQGDADRIVPPANADLVVRQWLETADLAGAWSFFTAHPGRPQ